MKKKKILASITAILLCAALSGCATSSNPKVVVWGKASDKTTIDVGKDYIFWGFEKQINEDGSCCVIVNFQPKNP